MMDLFDALTLVEQVGRDLRAGRVEDATANLDALEQDLLDAVYGDRVILRNEEETR